MKKEAFFIILLLLSLLLLPILPITARKPNLEESVNVEFEGDIITSSIMTLDVQKAWKSVIVYSASESDVDLTFKGEPQGLWYDSDSDLDFAGDQKGRLSFRVDPNTNNALVVFNFEEYIQEDVDAGIIIDRYVGWHKYQLMGPGQWTGDNAPIGSVSIYGEEFTICQLFYTPSGKGKGNSATGLSCVEVWRGDLTFDITIDPV